MAAVEHNNLLTKRLCAQRQALMASNRKKAGRIGRSASIATGPLLFATNSCHPLKQPSSLFSASAIAPVEPQRFSSAPPLTMCS
jgi:hypothetical protein